MRVQGLLACCEEPASIKSRPEPEEDIIFKETLAEIYFLIYALPPNHSTGFHKSTTSKSIVLRLCYEKHVRLKLQHYLERN